MSTNISEFSLTAEYILGRKRSAVTSPQINSSKHIWNPNDPRSFGTFGGQPSGAKEIRTTQQKEPHCAAMKSKSGLFFSDNASAYQLVNDQEKYICTGCLLTDLDL